MLPADLAVPEAAGAACLLCRLSTLPLAYVLSPIPPPPFPSGEGGDFLFSYARGFAPCIPGTEPEATLGQGGRTTHPAGGWLFQSPADLAVPETAGAACLLCRLSTPPLAYLLSPIPPTPLPQWGRGRLKVYFAGGYRPRHPCIKPFAALTASAIRAPHAGSLRFAAKTIGSGSLLAAPAAKERGDRGRGTSAFEMVLSPGAGIASAGRVQSSCGYHSGRTGRRQRRQAPLRTPQRQGRQATAPLHPRRYKMFTKVRASPP